MIFFNTTRLIKKCGFQFFFGLFELFHCFKSIRNLILMILVGPKCIFDGLGSILWEFPIFAMESLASLGSLESLASLESLDSLDCDSLESLEILDILEIWKPQEILTFLSGGL